ncbi:hypothetical protein T5B8_09266 [Salinisphaera sp. T5B8]|uniref:DoxX-like family protein n=1 Tax=unclassified Salinisphaera TaxID=2649847 RepID=UPI0033414C41
MAELARIKRYARYALAFVFIYHGLVPKLLWLDPMETAWVAGHHIPISAAVFAGLAGSVEILIGLSVALLRSALVPVYIAAALLILLLADAALFAPATLVAAFNPVTINIAALALCAVIQTSHRALAAG